MISLEKLLSDDDGKIGEVPSFIHRFRDHDPLDICLDKGLVDSFEHSAGLRLRWLYSLLFGSPIISAYDPTDQGGAFLPSHNSENWLISRKKEYFNIVTELKDIGAFGVISDICIYHQMPSFLLSNNDYLYYNDFELFKIGMRLLERLDHKDKEMIN